ncbi:MAG: hypothetical protein AAF637_17955 [Pseudomonadota bacterium]
MRGLIIVVVVAVAAYFGYRYFSTTDEGQQVAEQVEETAQEATEQVEAAAEAVTEEAEEAAEEVTEAAEEAADAATETAQEAADTVTETASEATDQATDTAQQAAQSVSELTVNGVDLGQEIGTMVSDATSALDGITDQASAEAALPSLEAVQTKLDELSGNVEGLPEAAKSSLASLLEDGLPALQTLVTKVEGMEGVGPVVKPTLDAIMSKLDSWAQQPT